MLLARDPRAPANEGRFRETPPRVFVQWVRPLAGSRHEVRETAELPVDEGIYALSRVTIEPLDAGWIVRIRGYQHAFMNDMAGAETVYQVDAPGEVRLMRAP